MILHRNVSTTRHMDRVDASMAWLPLPMLLISYAAAGDCELYLDHDDLCAKGIPNWRMAQAIAQHSEVVVKFLREAKVGKCTCGGCGSE
jgi:hypothetical protein